MYPMSRQDLRIYGSQYRVFRDGIFLGVATWTDDKNIGDSFQSPFTDKNGNPAVNVFHADEWELIPRENGR